jgi:biopolymer transport protein ExbD
MKRLVFEQSDIDANSGEGLVDMTPMLDVVFIMLIFFVVTASFVRESGIEVSRPVANTAEQQDAATLVIAINDRNEVWLDQRRIDVLSVRANLQRMLASNPGARLVVQADVSANMETFAAVVDSAREAGIKNVTFATRDQPR